MKTFKAVVALLLLLATSACQQPAPILETEFREVVPCLGLKLVADTSGLPEEIGFSVVTKNLCDERFDWFLGHQPPEDLIIRRGGLEVYRQSYGTPPADPGPEPRSYAPGEGETLRTIWRLVDNDENPVPSGEYEVTGALFGINIEEDEKEQRVETHRLTFTLER